MKSNGYPESYNLTPSTPSMTELEYLPVFGSGIVESHNWRRKAWLGRAAAWGAEDTPIASALAYDAANTISDDTRLNLAGIRDGLGKLGVNQRMVLESYLTRFYDPGTVMATTGHNTVSEWLGDKRFGASDEILLEHLEHHAQEVAAQAQSEQIVAAIYGLKKQRYEVEKIGSAEGWLSAYAGETASENYDVDVVIFDAWSAALSWKLGYYMPGTKKVMVAQRGQGEEGERGLIEGLSGHTLDHELNHFRFDSNKRLPRYEREALAQHVALAMKDGGGGVDIMDPDVRSSRGPKHSKQAFEQEYVYYDERKLLALELSGGYIGINPKVATRAYTSASEDSPEFSEYEQCLDASWGVDGFRVRLAGLIERREKWLKVYYPQATDEEIQSCALRYAQCVLSWIAQCQKSHPRDASIYAEELLAQSASSWSEEVT